MLTIVPVKTEAHLSTVRVLFEEYARSLSVPLDFQDFQAELAGLPGEYAPPRGALYLAEWEGKTAGSVALRPLKAEVCEMKRLYVRSEFRRLGLGRALCATAIQTARELGYGGIRLDTLPSMQEAIAMYSSFGFTSIDPYRFNPVEGTAFLELSFDPGEQGPGE